MIKIPITQIVSRNCGGHGAWIDNTLSSPSPGPNLWPGFQIGGRFKKVKVKTLRERTRRTRTRRTRRMRIKIKNTKTRRNTKKYK